MATLNGTQINNTYPGLIKTTDNAELGVGTKKTITDGNGNDTPLQLAQQAIGLEQGNQKININSTQTKIEGDTVITQNATATQFVTVDATSANIGGTVNYLTTNDTTAAFTGALDLSGATVTGLPADVDTTYDLASAQDGANVDITLTGSDATVDTVQLTAGTNITLTEAAGSITIDASGGGAAGLVSGTGTDSLKSSASLTTTDSDAPTLGSIALGDAAVIGQNAARPTWTALGHVAIGKGASVPEDSFADAYGNACIAIGDGATANPNYDGGTIAIGDGATASAMHGVAIGAGTATQSFGIAVGQNANAQSESVAVGRNANASLGTGVAVGAASVSSSTSSVAVGYLAKASGSGSDGRVAIGKQSEATANKAIAIGVNGTTCNAEGIALGDNVDIGMGNDRAIAIGNAIDITGTSSDDSITIGTQTNASNQSAIAIGRDASATADRSVALGRGVIAATASTVSVSALEVQTDSTPTAGGIIMSDAGGTDRRINITAGGSLQVDGGTTFTLPSFVTTVGADANDKCYTVVTIPANTYKDGDVVEFRSMVKRDGLTGTAYEGWYISEQSQTIGQNVITSATAMQIAGQQASNNGSLFYQKTMWLTTGNMTTWPYGVANETYSQGVAGGDPIETQTVDWTVTQYVYGQVYQDSTTGTLSNSGAVLRKIN